MRRADRAETLRILDRAGMGNPPLEGDELPLGLEGNLRPLAWKGEVFLLTSPFIEPAKMKSGMVYPVRVWYTRSRAWRFASD